MGTLIVHRPSSIVGRRPSPRIAHNPSLPYNACERKSIEQDHMAQPSFEPYTVALAQIDVTLGDLDANLAKHLEYVDKAREAGASLLVFPELSLTGYYLQDITNQIGQSVSPPAPPLQKLLDASRKHEIDLSVGFIE